MAARITNIIPFLLITLLCVGIVEGGYKVLEYFIMRSPVEKAAVSSTATVGTEPADTGGQKAKQDYHIILQRNLFGPPPGEGLPVSKTTPDYAEDLKLSSLNIVLMGTVNGREEEQRAIILDKSTNKQELYEKGDTIQGAQVKEILRGKVILVYNGKDEMLDMSAAAKERPVYVAPRPVGSLPRPVVTPGKASRRVISRPRVIRRSQSIIQQ